MALRWRSCSICLPGGARSGCQTLACLRRASWTSRFSNGGSSSSRRSACSMSRTCGTTFEGIGPTQDGRGEMTVVEHGRGNSPRPSRLLGVLLSDYTTLRLGGPAAGFVQGTTDARLLEALTGAERPVLLLAGGSNLVVADEGFPGTVVRIATRGIEREGDTLHVA